MYGNTFLQCSEPVTHNNDVCRYIELFDAVVFDPVHCTSAFSMSIANAVCLLKLKSMFPGSAVFDAPCGRSSG